MNTRVGPWHLIALLPALLAPLDWSQAQDNRSASPQGVRYDGGDEILLQGFHWNSSRSGTWYSSLEKAAKQIGADGFTAVWMPPPWRDESHWGDPNGVSGGGEGYFWRDFDKNSRYGNDEQLKLAVKALHQAGVKVIYDVVPNHSAGTSPDLKTDLRKNNGQFWRNDCPACDDGEGFMQGDADLNTANPVVYGLFRQEFENLRDHYGADGLRFDFVKGYAAERVDSWMQGIPGLDFCVGELWKAPNEYPPTDWRHDKDWQDALKDWSSRANCSVFDFALKNRMQSGDIRQWRHGLNGNPEPRWREVAVTFVDNHDTGYSPGANNGQHHWALPEEQRNLAYAYILSSPGTPTVYWPDMYVWSRGDLIRQLIGLRREAGIKADSPIEFLDNYSGLVARTTGTQGTVLMALDADLQSAPAQFTQALTHDNGRIRLWRSAEVQPSVPVLFSCYEGHTQPGESVYAVGTGAELGEWNPAHAVRLDDTSEYPLWKGMIRVPAQPELQWKCIVRRESDAQSPPLKWQPGANNTAMPTAGAATSGRF
ncbi:glucan 1,4-alpha-maltotetraohydrolase domain-containing protein [Pseudomonas sp. NPDC090755]|uniref:glucan 1,4-alpha-maltotetraohydrolase domain-containing protein n=1 Tax=Pseudomonas sp. NPDC090755 TaxID=3364481 RepID=UPI00383AA1EE